MCSSDLEIACWEEHEDPTALVTDTLRGLGIASGTIGIDEATVFATFDGLRRAGNAYDFVNGADIPVDGGLSSLAASALVSPKVRRWYGREPWPDPLTKGG